MTGCRSDTESPAGDLSGMGLGATVSLGRSALDCTEDDYPCSWADVDSRAIDRSLELARWRRGGGHAAVTPTVAFGTGRPPVPLALAFDPGRRRGRDGRWEGQTSATDGARWSSIQHLWKERPKGRMWPGSSLRPMASTACDDDDSNCDGVFRVMASRDVRYGLVPGCWARQRAARGLFQEPDERPVDGESTIVELWPESDSLGQGRSTHARGLEAQRHLGEYPETAACHLRRVHWVPHCSRRRVPCVSQLPVAFTLVSVVVAITGARQPDLANLLVAELEGVDGTEVLSVGSLSHRIRRFRSTGILERSSLTCSDGSVTLWQDGKDDMVGRPGDVLMVPLRQVHTAMTTDEGTTLLVFRVHEDWAAGTHPRGLVASRTLALSP